MVILAQMQGCLTDSRLKQNISNFSTATNLKKNILKKVLFSLVAHPPPSLLVARPLKKITFFAASLTTEDTIK